MRVGAAIGPRSSGRAAPWRPTRLGSKLSGWMAPDRASLITLASGNVQALLDAGGSGRSWTAPSSGVRPGLATGTGGRVCLVTTAASNTQLVETSSPAISTGDYSAVALAEFTVEGDLGLLLRLGAFGACLGLGNEGGQLWGGGAGQGSPVAPFPSRWANATPYLAGDKVVSGTSLYCCTSSGTSSGTGPLDDTGAAWALVSAGGILHVYEASRTSGVLQLYMDGVAVDSPDTSSADLAAGTGIGPHTNGFPTASSRIYQAAFLRGAPTRGYLSEAWRLAQYLAALNPLARKPTDLKCIGDSIVDGTNGGANPVTKTFPAYLQQILARDFGKVATVGRYGMAGLRTDEILGQVPTLVDPFWSPVTASRATVLCLAVNNYRQLQTHFSGSVSAAVNATTADIDALLARESAKGAQSFIAITLHKTVACVDDPDVETVRQQINTYLRALTSRGVRVVDVDELGEFQGDPNSNTNLYDGTHPLDVGYLAMATALAPVAAPLVV